MDPHRNPDPRQDEGSRALKEQRKLRALRMPACMKSGAVKCGQASVVCQARSGTSAAELGENPLRDDACRCVSCVLKCCAVSCRGKYRASSTAQP